MLTSSCFCKCYFYKRWLIPVINNLGTPSFEPQINFGVLQIDTENSATGHESINFSFPKIFIWNRVWNFLMLENLTSHICQSWKSWGFRNEKSNGPQREKKKIRFMNRWEKMNTIGTIIKLSSSYICTYVYMYINLWI